MAGYPSINGSTNGRHPNLIREQCCKDSKHGDKLRRMAIRNSYETRSLGGTSSITSTTSPSTATSSAAGHILPPLLSKRPPSMQRAKRYGERSVSPASLRCMEGRPRSCSDQLRVHLVCSQKDLLSTLKRSSSHSSVAVNRTTPTIQGGSSSYVYHTPSGRRIGRGSKSPAYENVILQDSPTSAMKRSSSCSTVIANSTGHSSSDSSPIESNDHGNVQASLTNHNSPVRERKGTARGNNPHPMGLVFQSPYNRNNKAFEVWNPDIKVIESRYPRMFKHIEHSNFTCGKMKAYDPEKRVPPDIQFSMDSDYRSSFQSPQSFNQFDKSLPITRFGSTPISLPAMGIVPYLMSPRCQSAAQTKVKRVRLHTPKGKKVASLV